MPKNISIKGVAPAIFIFSFLTFIFFNNSNILIRLILAPFIICSFCAIAKNICLMLKKPKIAHYFSIGYSLSLFSFAFGFLIYWCYTSIKNGKYLMVLLSIPLWLTTFYFVRSVFFKKTISSTRKILKGNVPIIITTFLVSIILISGIVLLTMGIKETIINAHLNENYETVEGRFIDYGIYNQTYNHRRTSITYYLVYEYEVNQKTYTTKTDYGTGTIPPINSTREIKYDPQNPENAIISGTNSSHVLLFIGSFFTLGGMIFVLIALQAIGILDKVKFDILGAYMGFVIVAIAIGIIFFRYGETGSLIDGLTSMGIFMIIPLIFIIAGSFLMIKSIFKSCSDKTINNR